MLYVEHTVNSPVIGILLTMFITTSHTSAAVLKTHKLIVFFFR